MPAAPGSRPAARGAVFRPHPRSLLASRQAAQSSRHKHNRQPNPRRIAQCQGLLRPRGQTGTSLHMIGRNFREGNGTSASCEARYAPLLYPARRVFPSTASRPACQTRLSCTTQSGRSFAVVLRAPCCPRLIPFCAGGTVRAGARPFERLCRSTPRALAPVRVLLSRSMHAYPAPSAPLADDS